MHTYLVQSESGDSGQYVTNVEWDGEGEEEGGGDGEEC